MTKGSVVVPILRYADARRAIGWLGEAFGFREQLVVADEKKPETIHHAQMVFGTGMVMLSSQEPKNDFDRLLPEDFRQNIYMIVPDADAHYAQAKKAGAQIAMDIVDQPYGGRGYTCLDPEGNIWSFGDYNPWQEGA